ncbi:unnamed protein product [Miscanthus lutarioriparius]|uniref:DUF659 domain-containing protein n=1 Tax=Miscanthus lutarioriparius TaxID=422564 RepID=A0A811S992_9POAL|nr:unnamed protein product [Miscanthus lutarioriparius]
MECGVAFNAANSRQFEIACEAMTQYGSAPRERFTESVDASSEVHSATMLADLLQEKIEDIGRDNVVQVVTDNGANYKAAGKILMDRIPTLFWSPCAAHCLDLMLEEIGNLKAFKKPIARAKRVTNFIYRHGRLLSAMRAQTGGTDLVRTAKTRFATSFLTLKSLYKNKDALKSLFQSQQVQDIVLSLEFWNSREDCLRASAPLLIVLRAVDGDEKPAMPEVWALMNHAKERIKQSFNIPTKDGLLKKIMEIIERRWVKQMDHPFAWKNDTDVETQMKINRRAIEYEEQRGEAFSNKMAKESYDKMNPRRNLPRRAAALFKIIDALEMFLLLLLSLKMAKRKTKLKTHMMMRICFKGMDATWEKSF